jgi:hypothetical protein
VREREEENRKKERKKKDSAVQCSAYNSIAALPSSFLLLLLLSQHSHTQLFARSRILLPSFQTISATMGSGGHTEDTSTAIVASCGAAGSRDLCELDKTEPILRENLERFCMFP